MDHIFKNAAVLIVWTMVTLEEASKYRKHDVAGGHANITDTPWIIAIVGLETFVGPSRRSRQDFDHAFCSGGLFHEQYVLTAAHCYRNPNGMHLVAGLDVFDVVDKSMLDNTTQVLDVHSWYNHPCYDKFTTPEFDIAVVRSNGTFKLGPKTRLIPLDADEWPQQQMYSRNCIAVFWEQKRLICNDPKDLVNGCLGTSGGLMVCDQKAVGVASRIRTINCLSFDGLMIRCHEPDSVVSFVYICPILAWIKEVASASSNVPSQPTSCSAVNSRQQFILMFIASCLWLITRDSM